ncbi:thioredoxin domain-containing protein [Pedobacter sp. AW1-32]|uniref:thioredoxin domain-containing protein n=1 Tax=Pedobacter sp. AW1-32 TaxID=3383026 RepID=UPI003FEDD4A4
MSFTIFIRNKSNSSSIVHKILEKLGVKFNSSSISSKLEAHPEYPSLLCISDFLSDWSIDNIAFKINKSEYDPDDLEFPFVAHLPEKGGRFIFVESIQNGLVNFSDEKANDQHIDEQEFLTRWDGITLNAEANANSAEPNYRSTRIKSFLNFLYYPAVVILIFAFFYVLPRWNFMNPIGIFIGLVKCIGLLSTILLLVQSVNSSNSFIANLCSLASKNGCNAILKSDAAKLTSWLSWSEVGFFYFFGSLVFFIFQQNSIHWLAWLSLATIPYTIYSIGYQYKNKNWCLLCCIVQGSLWTEFLLFFIGNAFEMPSFNLEVIPIAILSFLLPITVWVFLKPHFLQSLQLQPLRRQLNKFKYDVDLFNKMLTSQAKYAVDSDLLPVVLGNLDADKTITMVSNLFCNPCMKTHEMLQKWLLEKDDINVKIIFTTANKENDERTKVARHIIALNQLDDKKLVEEAIDNWYKRTDKNYEDWAKIFPVVFNLDLDIVMKKQKEWCRMVEITHTPTILINGYKLPDLYTLEEIKQFL